MTHRITTFLQSRQGQIGAVCIAILGTAAVGGVLFVGSEGKSGGFCAAVDAIPALEISSADAGDLVSDLRTQAGAYDAIRASAKSTKVSSAASVISAFYSDLSTSIETDEFSGAEGSDKAVAVVAEASTDRKLASAQEKLASAVARDCG